MTAKTTITDTPTDQIIYIFENQRSVVHVPGHNYTEARRKLDKWSGGKKGYKLKERRA